jgi:hypoxia up-regulated 1
VQVSSVNRIPKPKPKAEKKIAEEEPASKGKTTSSESAPNEGEYTETSQEPKAREGDHSASANSSDLDPESHDELWVAESIETGRKDYAYIVHKKAVWG